MKKILLILIIGLFLYSCEKEEDQPKIYTSLDDLGDFLKDIDKECAYQIYLKDSTSLKMWIDTLTDNVNEVYDDPNNMCTALHETNHMINARHSGVKTEIYLITNGTAYETNAISYGNPKDYNFTLFSCNDIFVTGINDFDVYNNTFEIINIVSETIPHNNFKNDNIYKFYFENNGVFSMLLDEWNSYLVEDNFFINYQQYKKFIGIKKYGNTIKFMLYIQCYLKSARLKYPYTYDAIKNNSELINLIQSLWIKSEETLYNGFKTFQISKQYFEYIYSNDFLQELDSLGIQHQDMKYWKKTYMSEKYPYDI